MHSAAMIHHPGPRIKHGVSEMLKCPDSRVTHDVCVMLPNVVVDIQHAIQGELT